VPSLENANFRNHITKFAKENIKAHIDGLDEAAIKAMPRETQISYSRPPDPDSDDWDEEFNDRLRRVVRSQQVHTCTRSTCLRYDRHGHLTCKRRAPWTISEHDEVDDRGNYVIQRIYPFINSFCPAVSVAMACNNDIQLLTNGEETKHIMWYLTTYQSKKQGKNFNVSALMAKSLLYHEAHRSEHEDLLDRNHLLIFRCQHAINREMEMSAPQVISYLMKWGDRICSHNYVHVYWSSLRNQLYSVFPDIRPGRDRIS
jgi:hypothetical protein